MVLIKTPGSNLRGPGRPRGDSDLPERLLLAAEAAFVTASYEAASLRAIARAAECDVSMVAHYFGSKAQLWQAVIDSLAERRHAVLEDMQRRVNKQVGSRARLQCALECMFDHIAADMSVTRMLLREAADASSRAGYIEERLAGPVVAAYRPLWEAAMRDGVIAQADVMVVHTWVVGAISAVVALRATIAHFNHQKRSLPELRQELCVWLLGPLAAGQ